VNITFFLAHPSASQEGGQGQKLLGAIAKTMDKGAEAAREFVELKWQHPATAGSGAGEPMPVDEALYA
jgi:hypothetical protein